MIAITLGEPAGIGLELVAKLAAQEDLADCVLVGDREMIQATLPNLPCPIEHVPLVEPAQLGQLNPANARYVLKTIEVATNGCLDGRFRAMVTNPIHKGVINQAGITFSGHTEYLAALTQTPQVVMMLLNQQMRVALVTTHIPLKEVSDQISSELLLQVISIVHADLKSKFGIKQPQLAVCGLNPHAGEDGHMGTEEIEIINPTLTQLRDAGMAVTGTIPADSLFTPNKVKQYDAIIAMYHDQGLAPLKYAGFGESVNITLGLPIIRTSVDHGTALDIAGQNLADPGSLLAALKLARDCAQS